MELWQALLVGFGGNAALLALMAYLGKSIISNVLLKDLRKYENNLQIKAYEHNIRFSKLHEKRGAVIAELYKLLVAAYWETSSFASPMEFSGEPDRKTKYINAMNAISKYFRYFDQHRIFMPAELCSALEGFASALRTPTINAGVYLNIDYPTDTTQKDMFKAWIAAWNSVQKDIPKLREKLESEFRKLLVGPNLKIDTD